MSVRMRHEGVEEQITVAEESVPFHAAAGWEVVEDDEQTDHDDTASGQADDGEKAKSGRRPSATPKKKEQD